MTLHPGCEFCTPLAAFNPPDDKVFGRDRVIRLGNLDVTVAVYFAFCLVEAGEPLDGQRRHERAIERRIKGARFPEVRTLADFD